MEHIKVSSVSEAWRAAARIFPTDYEKNEENSKRAGYPIYETTSTDERFSGFHISDLNTRLEVNMGNETVTIWIEEDAFEIVVKGLTEEEKESLKEQRAGGTEMEKERYLKYVKICERAERMKIDTGDRMGTLMDIESADKKFNMRLDDWLQADDFNFAHDYCGIQNNIKRGEFPATDFGFFLPRFAGTH